MKILIHSNAPWAPTGYGQQTGLFAERFQRLGHDVAISATWGLHGAQLEWHGMRVYPSDDSWGNRTLGAVAAHFGDGDPVLVLTLGDVWVFTAPSFAELNVAAWTPVDHAPAPPKVAAFFHRTGATPIAMSRFGERMLRQEGLEPLYAPHAVDCSVFRPLDRAECRDHLGLPQDAFVVGMVAANKGWAPPRKAFGQVFAAVGELCREHDDAWLYVHAECTGVHGGVNLMELARACKIPPDRIKLTNPAALELGVGQERMAAIFSAFDVLANPSYGEGFGVPIIEAQACGTPVIVSDVTAMPELCGAGWIVETEPWWDCTQGAFFGQPLISSVHGALQRAYNARGDQQLRDQARTFAVAYDAERVLEEFWAPVLERLDPSRPERELPAPEVHTSKAAA
ncbi:MAG: glycosyltransferase family 4 protein [Steroidobacteraceae bacterium]|nr:glycosyltransferase family 4 protein [Steroidobacteraceae bacterium]